MTRQSQGPNRRLNAEGQAQTVDHFYLVEQLARKQYRLCQYSVPLDELRGEAQLALVRAGCLYDSSRGQFLHYARRAIRNHLIQAVTRWRHHGRLSPVPFSELGESNFEPVCPRSREARELAEQSERMERVRRVLPPRWSVLLDLHFAEGRSMEEIAGQVGLSRPRVGQLVARALDRARRHG